MALAVVAMALVSCTDFLKRKEQDAGAIATPTDPINAQPIPTQTVLALNQGDIARYPDETPTPVPTPVVFQRNFNIRESVPNGKIVAGLGKGATVTQIAKRPPYVLITFPNASNPAVTMMGWVHQDAFSLVVADAGALTCAAGETPLMSDVPTCGKVCTKDADCAAGFGCTGNSNKLAPGNKPGEAVKVCAQTVVKDAGAPAPTPPAVKDAGPPAVVDAGKPAVVDAGPTPPPPNTACPEPAIGTDEKTPCPNKTCPTGWTLASKTGRCHRPCNIAGGKLCAPNHFCSSCDGKQSCTNERGVCK